MELADYKIGYVELRAAIDMLRSGAKVEKANMAVTTYVFDPEDMTAWDLEPVVTMASEIAIKRGFAKKKLLPSEFNSRKFQPVLLSLGFPLIRFDFKKQRNLGVRGYEVNAFRDEHDFFPHSIDEPKRNGFAPQTSTAYGDRASNGPVTRSSGVVFRFLRNTEHVRTVLARARGVCEACEGKTFKTPGCDWYLEAHHKHWLSEGGPDVVENMIALCPNCHRQEHHGSERRYW